MSGIFEGLSEQQEAFCAHYATHGNGAAAVRVAYPKTAKLGGDRQSELGRRLLRKTKIKARVAELRAALAAHHFDHEPAQARSTPAPRPADVGARLARAGIQRRGLTLDEAAAYIGLSPKTFLAEVAAGTMPRPLQLKARRRLWDRLALDRAIEVAQLTRSRQQSRLPRGAGRSRISFPADDFGLPLSH